MLESPLKFGLIPSRKAGLAFFLGLFLCGVSPLATKLAAQSSSPCRFSVRASSVEGQGGIRVKARSVIFGNARHCRAPATIDFKKVLDATPEMQEIQEEGIQKGSARYIILIAKAVKRIRKVVAKVAVSQKRDCVVKEGSIRENPHDLEISDLTDEVIESIEDVEIGDQEN